MRYAPRQSRQSKRIPNPDPSPIIRWMGSPPRQSRHSEPETRDCGELAASSPRDPGMSGQIAARSPRDRDSRSSCDQGSDSESDDTDESNGDATDDFDEFEATEEVTSSEGDRHSRPSSAAQDLGRELADEIAPARARAPALPRCQSPAARAAGAKAPSPGTASTSGCQSRVSTADGSAPSLPSIARS